ncbi:hypothetical protein CPB85DRAFT_1252610 [Mucidula mucida]|nr:hypothetical protein CPB85DRAFT_1252610 [Mucidula mucida]
MRCAPDRQGPGWLQQSGLLLQLAILLVIAPVAEELAHCSVPGLCFGRLSLPRSAACSGRVKSSSLVMLPHWRGEGFREEDLAKREPAVKQKKRQKVVFDPNDVLDLTYTLYWQKLCEGAYLESLEHPKTRCSAQNVQDHCAHEPNDNGLLGATVAAELNKSKIEHWHVMVRKPVAYRTNTYTENHECLKKAVPHHAQSFVYPFWSVSLTLILQIGTPEGSAYTNSAELQQLRSGAKLSKKTKSKPIVKKEKRQKIAQTKL